VRIDEVLSKFGSPGGGELPLQEVEYPGHRPASGLELKAPVTGLVGRIPRRQILPRRPGPHHPEDPVQDIARVTPGTPAAIGPSARRRQEGREPLPLRFREIHWSPPERIRARRPPLRRLTSPLHFDL